MNYVQLEHLSDWVKTMGADQFFNVGDQPRAVVFRVNNPLYPMALEITADSNYWLLPFGYDDNGQPLPDPESGEIPSLPGEGPTERALARLEPGMNEVAFTLPYPALVKFYRIGPDGSVQPPGSQFQVRRYDLSQLVQESGEPSYVQIGSRPTLDPNYQRMEMLMRWNEVQRNRAFQEELAALRDEFGNPTGTSTDVDIPVVEDTVPGGGA
ncbi:hypothetical protein [Tortoise microvirus 37]|nr:hypothetical protein [Tortoise microvirus 37]